MRRKLMYEATFEVRVPTNLLEYGFDQSQLQQHVTEWIVLSLFTEERISSGKAAQLLSMTRLEFLSLLRRRNIAYIDYSAEEIAEELEAVKALQTNSSL